MAILYIVVISAASILYIVLTVSCYQSPHHVSGGYFRPQKVSRSMPFMAETQTNACTETEKNRPRFTDSVTAAT
jgi:hypothetical protein